MALTASAKRNTLPYAIFLFWVAAMFVAWTLPLLSRPAQGAPKAKTSQESHQEGEKRDHGKEAFRPGPFPEALDKSLLADTYDSADPVSLGPYTAAEGSRNYPVFPAGSCGTNNLRYWKRPGNGTAGYAEFDGALYSATEPVYPAPPKAPAWDSGIRVNFYESCLYNR